MPISTNELPLREFAHKFAFSSICARDNDSAIIARDPPCNKLNIIEIIIKIDILISIPSILGKFILADDFIQNSLHPVYFVGVILIFAEYKFISRYI